MKWESKKNQDDCREEGSSTQPEELIQTNEHNDEECLPSEKSDDAEKKGKLHLTKKQKRKWIIFGAVGVFLIIVMVAVIVVYSNTVAKVTHVDLDTNELGINTTKTIKKKITKENGETVEIEVEAPDVKNIAAFGLSVTDSDGIDTDRSDVIIVISLDTEVNRICLTSILRDTQADIEGYYPQKINAAYKYGGAPLAINTLNRNFNLDIEDYVTYRSDNIAEIVDYLGGVDVELTEDEIYAGSLYGCSPGMNTLNGEEAVRYSQIRNIDSDYYRASRQQTVLYAMLSKVRQIPKTEYPALISMVLECTETSLNVSEILDYATKFDLSTVEVVSNTIPDKNYETDLWGGIADTGEWLYIYDLDAAAKRLNKIIYERSKNGVD